jgi:hypothetical protein
MIPKFCGGIFYPGYFLEQRTIIDIRIKIALSPTGFMFLCILLLPLLFSLSTVLDATDELQGDFHLVYITNNRAEG